MKYKIDEKLEATRSSTCIFMRGETILAKTFDVERSPSRTQKQIFVENRFQEKISNWTWITNFGFHLLFKTIWNKTAAVHETQIAAIVGESVE